ncbi:hypothetical protein [Azospirillum sp. TSO5]|uniref:DUF7220 family protein n=1 Tax=Azospirillum sp. TSO5 TaxID=716760 RepID=UPI000D609288|nr:hypothetical protein [Azospirillum sp. TSO5]PWC98018.1 hypothetical protein TSO5_03560 [Azospirillum sp. TSO5]
MSQSRLMSAVEAAANTASGFVLSWLAGMVIYPLIGWPVSAAQNTVVVTAFTIISLLRSFVWRRIFNHIHQKGS